MSFCPRCGATTADGARFCGACGATLAAVPAPSFVPPPGARPAGPAGQVREPWLPILLSLVTLGVYWLVYWWLVSKETDAYEGRPGHAHSLVKWGVLARVAGMVAAIMMAGALFTAIAGNPEMFAEDANPTEEQMAAFFASMMSFMGLMMLGGIASLVGLILLAMGEWRVWKAIEADERRRGHASPISPGLMLALVLVPYVNFVTMWIAMHRTQTGLNGMWEGAPPALA